MKSPLHILHLEDDANDASLVQAALEAAEIPMRPPAWKGAMTLSRRSSAAVLT